MSSDLRAILSLPWAYRMYTRFVSRRHEETLVNEYIKPSPRDRVLDIGCGPGDILAHLPAVDYLGFDMNERYIDEANTRFSDRGTFLCKRVSREAIEHPRSFDIVLALGVLHHLDDDDAMQLFELAHYSLKSNGRLITFDGCYHEGQGAVARYMLASDRGKFVRTQAEYVAIASRVFSHIQPSLRRDLLRIPYSHLIMVCSASAAASAT